MGLLHLHHVQLHTQAWLLGHLHVAAFDLQWLLGQALAVLPYPVRVNGGDLARRGCAHMREHGQRDVEVVVGMGAPGQAKRLAQLRHTHRAGHGPEMRVGQRNVDRLQRQAVRHLAPVGGDHVGGGRQTSGAAEFGHHFAAAEHAFSTTRVFRIGHHAAHALAQANRVFQQPAAVGVECHAGFGEAFMQCNHGIHFLVATQHAALELEVLEAITLLRCFGQAHNGLGCHGFFVAHAEPVVVGAGLAAVRQVGLVAVAHIEQVSQHLHRFALLAVTQQGGNRHIEVFAQQVEQGRFSGSDRMDGDAQVKRLLAAPATVALGKLRAHGVQDGLVVADGLAHDEGAGVFQRLADFFAARHFTHAGVACAVGQHQDVAGEERAMGAAQVHQHAVVACYGDHAQVGDAGGGSSRRSGHKQ